MAKRDLRDFLEDLKEDKELPDPPALRRYRRIVVWSAVMSWLASMLAMVVAPWGSRSPLFSMVATVGVLAATVILWVIAFQIERWHARKRAAAENLLCLHCEYLLKGLPEKGDCPECGHAYVLENVRSRWRRVRPMWMLCSPYHRHEEEGWKDSPPDAVAPSEAAAVQHNK